MKKRNSILTIDLSTITHNIDVLQSYLADGVQSMAVVKANAYGHGAIEVAHHIQSQVHWFAVNSIDGGVELRENGITHPILVFGVPEEEIARLYIQHDLTATVSALEQFATLPAGTEYHLNIDAGMSRLGFRPEQVDEVIAATANHPQLQCTGVYSHFATADEPESSMPREQYQLFKKIRSQFGSKLKVHMCNSAGLVQFREAHFDMVRFGIGMYGYAPGNVCIPNLKPAIGWQTQLVQVNTIKKGETVSYGATWKAEENGYIGIIPVGYSDGIPRSLSGKFEVTIEGKTYPVVGKVTMNYCMIWLDEDEFSTGTKVELLSDDHNANNWAEITDTIPYEILTGIIPAIPRQYRSGDAKE